MRNYITLILSLGLAVALQAEPIKLKNSELDSLASGLAALDARTDRVVDQGKDVPAKVVQVSYDFSGKTRFAVAKNIVTLKSALEAIEQARTSLVKQTAVTEEDEKNKTPVYAKFVELFQQVLDNEVTLDLQRLKEEDLKLDANPIPSLVMLRLTPLIEGLAKKNR